MLIQPNENDILLGRGGNNNKHVGNAQLRRLVQMHCGAYKKSNKKAKSAIAWELVKYIQNLSPPGRFLRKDPETYFKQLRCIATQFSPLMVPPFFRHF